MSAFPQHWFSPIAGRMVDRHDGWLVMSLGSVVAAAGLTALALSQNWTTYLAAWMILGVANSMALYEAAFAALAQISITPTRAGRSTICPSWGARLDLFLADHATRPRRLGLARDPSYLSRPGGAGVPANPSAGAAQSWRLGSVAQPRL